MYKKTIPVARYIHQARNFVRLFTPISKLWASINNIAVQGRLTTYSDRQKCGDKKTSLKTGRKRKSIRVVLIQK